MEVVPTQMEKIVREVDAEIGYAILDIVNRNIAMKRKYLDPAI